MGIKSIALAATTLILSTSAHSALVEYTYQGNMFTDVVNNILPAGETFTNTDSITGSFVVSDLGANHGLAPITVESFSFSAGSITISSSDGLQQIDRFYVSTDTAGTIDGAIIRLLLPNQEWFDLDPDFGIRDVIEITEAGSDQARHEQCALLNRAGDKCNPNRNDGEFGHPFDSGISLATGIWTSQTISAVPVPAAFWLFGSGLIGLIGVARRKKA